MEIPFIGGSYKGDSPNVNSQRCVNLYPEIDKRNSKNAVILYSTPGLVELVDVPFSQIPPPPTYPTPVLISHIDYNDSSDRVGYSEGNAFDLVIPTTIPATEADGAVWSYYSSNYREDGWFGQAFGVGNEKIVRSFRINAYHYDDAPATISFKASTTGAFAGEEVTLDIIQHPHGYWPLTAGWMTWNVDNDTAYPFYRVYIADIFWSFSGTYLFVNEVEMYDQQFLTDEGEQLIDFGRTNWAWRGWYNNEYGGYDRYANPGGRYALGVINSDSGTYGWTCYNTAYRTSGWLCQKFPYTDLKIINEYGIYVADVPTAPKTWTFEGSPTGLWDGEQTILDSQTNYVFPAEYGWNYFPFTCTTPYKAYRFNVSENNGDPTYLRLREFAMFGERYYSDIVYEDFTTFTVVDPLSRLTITENEIIGTGVQNQDNFYMYRPLSSPVGDFQLRVEMKFSYTDEYTGFWMFYLTNTPGSASTAHNAGDGVGLEVWRGNYNQELYLENYSTGSRNDVFMQYNNYTYWAEFTRQGTRLIGKIFAEVNCINPSWYAEVVCVDTEYSYFGIASSRNLVGTQTCAFELKNMHFDPIVS